MDTQGFEAIQSMIQVIGTVVAVGLFVVGVYMISTANRR